MISELVRFEVVPIFCLLSAVLASFGCVVADRVPAGKSLWSRSRCACGKPLRAWRLVPVLSWLATAGRARCCGSRVPLRYVLAEIAMAGTGAALGYRVRVEINPGRLWWPLAQGGLFLVVSTGLMIFLLWRSTDRNRAAQ